MIIASTCVGDGVIMAAKCDEFMLTRYESVSIGAAMAENIQGTTSALLAVESDLRSSRSLMDFRDRSQFRRQYDR